MASVLAGRVESALRVLQGLHGDLEEMELGVSKLDRAMAQGG